MPKEKTALPPLYHRDSKGKVRVWRVWTEGPYVCSEAGMLGGKMTKSRRRCEAKNVGRSNSTTPEGQALLEAQADWQHKIDRKYSAEVPAEDDVLPLPMLAHPMLKKDGTLTSHGKKAVYPAHVQPKFDGVRCIARRVNGEIVLHSRNGKPYDVPHVAQQLAKWLPEGMELDGEVYHHGTSLQQITSLVKRPRPASLSLHYLCYDMPRFEGEVLPWEERVSNLFEHLIESASVKLVKHVEADSFEAVRDFHDRFRERGFEGAIVRLLDGVYAHGYRSAALLKVKAFQSAEFVVTNCEQGKGKDEGTATFVCEIGDGRTFKARMKGTIDERRAFWTNREDYYGRKLTVEFFGYTEEGVPFHPVGVAFRDEKDL